MNQDEFGKFIKNIRKKNNLTQKDLADKYGVTYQAVSKWENGKNMPDISLIKQMSKDFGLSLDEMLDCDIKEKDKRSSRKKINFIIICAVVILIVIIIGFICFNSDNSDFEFKTLSTSCGDFNISGSISYNKNKSSIYITNITYCGEEDDNIYQKIECTLYEQEDNIEKKISSYSELDVTLEEFLSHVTLTVDNYQSICQSYQDSNLYLVINITDNDNKITSYDIPLIFEDSCNSALN